LAVRVAQAGRLRFAAMSAFGTKRTYDDGGGDVRYRG
jgi:hypothetical protein